jgi:hypothetical protein
MFLYILTYIAKCTILVVVSRIIAIDPRFFYFMHDNYFLISFLCSELKQAQLGLGHSYSRSKVKFNVHRVDNMVFKPQYCFKLKRGHVARLFILLFFKLKTKPYYYCYIFVISIIIKTIQHPPCSSPLRLFRASRFWTS